MNNNNLIISSSPRKYIIPDQGKMSHIKPIEMNQGLALSFLQILFTYGKLSCGFSYGLEGFISVQGNMQYYIRTNRILAILSRIIYAFLCVFQMMVVINFDFAVSYSKLVNWIKRITYGFFVVKLIITMACLEYGGRKQGIWVKILEQADIIQKKFATLGIYAPSGLKVKIFGSLICIVSVLLCVVHMMVFANHKDADASHWYAKYAGNLVSTLTFNLIKLDVESGDLMMLNIIGYLGLGVSILLWNLWYLCDSIRIFSSLIVWMVFRKLNTALSSKKLTMDNLSDVLDLHFKGIKLLNLFNQLMSPITLVSTIFNLGYVCFWTNYALISFEFKITHIVGAITLARMCFVFYITADVNTQAYQISTWLENSFAEMDTPPKVDREKLTLFTSLIYSRDAIGFKGLHFFTVTPALNSAIASLVITYSVVVNQFATQ